jgi:hypothetical protein
MTSWLFAFAETKIKIITIDIHSQLSTFLKATMLTKASGRNCYETSQLFGASVSFVVAANEKLL